MHAHDRTLIASLGFRDPDKSDSRHDLACKYLATEVTALKVARIFNPTASPPSQGRLASLEYPVVKGTGQYRSVVGFIDARINFEVVVQEEYCPYDSRTGKWLQAQYRDVKEEKYLSVEVKTNLVPLGDILRQINLYRQFSDADYWVVATTYPISESDNLLFINARVKHIFLGSGFDSWVAEQAAESRPSSSLEL